MLGAPHVIFSSVTALDEPSPDRTRRLVLLAVGGLGVSAVMTQLALLRELLTAFTGNELVFGIGLGSWLLLTGIGTWLGRFLAPKVHSQDSCHREAREPGRGARPGLLRRLLRRSPRNDNLEPFPGHREKGIPSLACVPAGDAPPPAPDGDEGAGAPAGWFIAGLLCIAILPLFQIGAVRMLRDVIFIRGSAVGVSGTILGTLTLLAAFLPCFGHASDAGLRSIGPRSRRDGHRPRLRR